MQYQAVKCKPCYVFILIVYTLHTQTMKYDQKKCVFFKEENHLKTINNPLVSFGIHIRSGVLHSHRFQSASNVGFALLTPCLRMLHLIRTESSQTNITEKNVWIQDPALMTSFPQFPSVC